jgi:hypothetical protein
LPRAIASTVGILLMATAALAAGNVPTRYAGSFPAAGLVSNITGTFAGKRLVLHYTFARRSVVTRTSATYSCSRTSSSETLCTGRWRTDDGIYGGPAEVTVAWSAGQPVALSFADGKC